jgi:DNA-binding MarR family transcriptional regulator
LLTILTRRIMTARGSSTPDELADRWHGLAIQLLRRLRREDVKAGLTGPRLSALSVIVFAGPITLGELAAAEQVRPPTMTRLVRALEDAGLVRRESDKNDRRVVRLRATARGESVLHAGRARRVKRLATPLADLSPADRRKLQEAADVLAGVVSRLS